MRTCVCMCVTWVCFHVHMNVCVWMHMYEYVWQCVMSEYVLVLNSFPDWSRSRNLYLFAFDAAPHPGLGSTVTPVGKGEVSKGDRTASSENTWLRGQVYSQSWSWHFASLAFPLLSLPGFSLPVPGAVPSCLVHVYFLFPNPHPWSLCQSLR